MEGNVLKFKYEYYWKIVFTFFFNFLPVSYNIYRSINYLSVKKIKLGYTKSQKRKESYQPYFLKFILYHFIEMYIYGVILILECGTSLSKYIIFIHKILC